MTCSDDDMIRRGDARRILEEEGFLERSLANLNALPAVQVAVKPLEWRTIQDKYDGGREHYGTGAFGHWYCVHRRKSGVWDIVHHVDGKPIHFEPCDTIEAAKSAAQADYDARIRSTLTAQPSPDVAALVEAADKLLDAYSAIVGAGNPWGDELRAALARVKGGAK